MPGCGEPRGLCHVAKPVRAPTSCTFASSGEDALSKLDNGVDPQLIVILSDINMPGMDGLTLLGEIKRRWPELPVMMVTAYGDDERRRRADEYGGRGVHHEAWTSTC